LKIRGNGEARVGISIGTATFGNEGETLDQLLVAADQAMYRAKSNHKLEKVSREIAVPESIVELERDNLASVSVN
jgi:GGDEF domain-containing protein